VDRRLGATPQSGRETRSIQTLEGATGRTRS
jgi:hypothetical protein